MLNLQSEIDLMNSLYNMLPRSKENREGKSSYNDRSRVYGQQI